MKFIIFALMKVNKTIEAGFFYGAKPDTFDKARQLRKNLTEAEKKLWSQLKMGAVYNLHFRHQHPINRFIADFYCHAVKLVIEVDGGIHSLQNRREYDQGRDYFMNEIGLNVIRFTNEQVMNECNKVLFAIKKEVEKLDPKLSK